MIDPRTGPLDDILHGVPPGTSGLPFEAAGPKGWHPSEGATSFPAPTLDEAVFEHDPAARACIEARVADLDLRVGMTAVAVL